MPGGGLGGGIAGGINPGGGQPMGAANPLAGMSPGQIQASMPTGGIAGGINPGGTPASGGKGGGVLTPVTTPPVKGAPIKQAPIVTDPTPQPTSAPAAAPSVYQQAAGGLQQAMGTTEQELRFFGLLVFKVSVIKWVT